MGEVTQDMSKTIKWREKKMYDKTGDQCLSNCVVVLINWLLKLFFSFIMDALLEKWPWKLLK